MMPLVLIPHGVHEAGIYIRELGRAYAKIGCRVVFNADNLAEALPEPDVVHLHWPEDHYRWRGRGAPRTRGLHFLADIDRLKAAGSAVVWTVHNLAPHEFGQDPLDRELYQATINRTDVIVHHCVESRALLSTHYQVPESTRELVLPFGHYGAYARGISKEAARQRLNLTGDAFVYLHFGMVREYKGMDLLFKAFSAIRVPNKILVVAGRHMGYASPWAPRSIAERARYAYFKRISGQIRPHLHEIPEDEIQTFMSASDVVVLAHRAVLNSGVGVLAMTFGKLVIGPDLGCLPWVLAQGQNLVYRAGDSTSLANSMAQATRLDLVAAGNANAAAAMRWDWVDNARQIINAVAMSKPGTMKA